MKNRKKIFSFHEPETKEEKEEEGSGGSNCRART
jgi:hypothetical protein